MTIVLCAYIYNYSALQDGRFRPVTSDLSRKW